MMDLAERSRLLQLSDLPSEIRTQIWQNVLPDKIEPALFPYKPGCWQPWFISENDKEFDPVNFFGIHMMYELNFIDPMKFDLPLFFVNVEARDIVRAWMREHDVRVHFQNEKPKPVFTRRFDPLQDALYVSPERYQEFACELLERGFKPDLIGQTHSYGFQDIPNVAVSENLFWTISSEFGDVALDWFCPKILYILLNVQEDLCSYDKDDGKRHQWIFETSGQRALIWDYDSQWFVWDNGEHVCDDDLYRRIGEAATTDMVLKLVNCRIREFEIRPVLGFKISEV